MQDNYWRGWARWISCWKRTESACPGTQCTSEGLSRTAESCTRIRKYGLNGGGSCTLKATHYKDPVKVLIVASRGRNPDKPTSRIAGLPTEQRLEIQRGGYTNTLTSVQKDNLVLEVRNE